MADPQSIARSAPQATTVSRKRTLHETHNSCLGPATSKPWHNHEELGEHLARLCDTFITPLQRYASLDPAIANLILKASVARKLPDLKRVRIALLGDQGVGKSTTINALLKRPLLGTSSGSIACTCFATIVEHKEGAADDTRLSDVRIEFLSKEELRLLIIDLINSYYDYHFAAAEQDEEDKNEDPDPDLEGTVEMAVEFFRHIFKAKENPRNLEQLEAQLGDKSVREGDFLRLCLHHAEICLRNITSDLHPTNGVFLETNVPDRELFQTRNTAKKHWPFVKAMIISTGHDLLRLGLSLLDLPGLGDTSQLRSAVVNRYRDTCNYVIHVAPHARASSNLSLERQLDISLSKGPDRTMLLLTKSDNIFEENGFGDAIREINEEPFISLTARLDALHEASEEAYGHETSDKHDQIAKESAAALVEYHTKVTIEQMDNKGIKILAAAPREYLAWNNPLCRRKPILDPQSCGISALRHHLSGLPANTNFRDYEEHFSTVLPQVRQKALHIYESHVEDEGYANMRWDLKQQMPNLRLHLQHIRGTLLDEVVLSPWSQLEKQEIAESIENFIETKCIQPKIRHPGWLKMLRENGIPRGGKYRGRNLNQELLGTMVSYIDKWKTAVVVSTESFTQRLWKPAQQLLYGMAQHIHGSSADADLKNQAQKALEDTLNNIEGARRRLLDELIRTLDTTYTRYTTEIDVLSPIAQEMQRRYERAYEPRFAGSGSGVYSRQRTVLIEEILEPTRVFSWEGSNECLSPLLDNIRDQIMRQVFDSWRQSCTIFIGVVDYEIQEFSRSIDNLLMTDAYVTEEHKKVRELLGPLLANFDADLEQIQGRLRDANQMILSRAADYEQKRSKFVRIGGAARTLRSLPSRNRHS